jgi:hypothetical protein
MRDFTGFQPFDSLAHPVHPLSIFAHGFTLRDVALILLVFSLPFILGCMLASAAVLLWRRAKWGAAMCAGLSLLCFLLGCLMIRYDDSDRHFRQMWKAGIDSDPEILHGIDVRDTDLALLRRTTKLRTLYLSSPRVNGQGLVHLEGLNHLKHLHLSYTNIDGASLKHLEGLTLLEQLDLSHTNIDGASLRHLRKLPHLTELNLAFCPRVGDEAVSDLARLKSLQKLDIHMTQISEQGKKDLAMNLPDCEIISIGNET